MSVRARAGEFVAIVGESGAGKSTLFRLALGLEAPLSGAVYYDGRDLGRLNRRAVRSRISMVVQDASVHPGTVLENIVGLSGDFTEADAWEAARLAAIDEDIAAMPMGMHTVVGDTASVFSGGQIQRIMLAAALARDPSVLFLDEATNWLDNRSQARVMESVAGLGRHPVRERAPPVDHPDGRQHLRDRGRPGGPDGHLRCADGDRGPLPGPDAPADGLTRRPVRSSPTTPNLEPLALIRARQSSCCTRRARPARPPRSSPCATS